MQRVTLGKPEGQQERSSGNAVDAAKCAYAKPYGRQWQRPIRSRVRENNVLKTVRSATACAHSEPKPGVRTRRTTTPVTIAGLATEPNRTSGACCPHTIRREPAGRQGVNPVRNRVFCSRSGTELNELVAPDAARQCPSTTSRSPTMRTHSAKWHQP